MTAIGTKCEILVSAYACEPGKGSEQGVGWNWVLQMAKDNYLHVITRANNRQNIEGHVPDDVSENITFYYYDTPAFFRGFKNKSEGVYIYYLFWQIGIIPLIRRIFHLYKPNYSMHLTFGGVWFPTFLPFFKPEFIWGTLGGGEAIPHSFIKSLSVKGRILQLFRYVLKATIYINPFFMYSSIKAKAILCRTECTVKLFPSRMQHKVHLVPDGAIEPYIFKYQTLYERKDVTDLIITSRLIHTKNIITAIRAFKYIPDNYKVRLTIVGSGPEEESIESEIEKLNIQDKVKLIPVVPREEVFQMLSGADIYIFPSLKEACNLSLLEAMAIGLPVICLNWSGMAVSTDDTSAIRLPVSDPDQMPRDMADAICRLVENPQLRKEMGQAGRKRVANVFSWDSKGDFMRKLFAELERPRC